MKRVAHGEPNEKGPKLKGLLVNRRPVPKEGSASCSFSPWGKEIRAPDVLPLDSLFKEPPNETPGIALGVA